MQTTVLNHPGLQPRHGSFPCTGNHADPGEGCDRGRSDQTPRPDPRPAPTVSWGSDFGDLKDRLDRVMTATARPKSIGLWFKPRLPLGLQRVQPRVLGARGRGSLGSRAGAALPPGLGMNTRLTGIGLNTSAGSCTLETNCSLASSVSTTSPSTPAVKRPLLRSVTRRTLTSVFDRDRSINCCNRRTLGRSPALDAVKIRCRNRRTSRSAPRQSIWRQPEQVVLWSTHHDDGRGV